MYNTSFIKKILLAATVVLLYSCDKDFNAIGDNLIGDDHFGLEAENYDVVAYNQEITPIQSNGLIVNALGIYDNPVLGTTTGNFATQVTLASYAPTIGDEPEIVSVVLSIPYFSHATSVTTNTDGTTTTAYALDSIYGAPEGKIKLSVYESGVQMRATSVENGTQVGQLYNTDMDTNLDGNYINFDAKKVGNRLNDRNIAFENDEFFFNSNEITDVTTGTDGKDVTTKVAPEMRLNLNKTFFFDRILKAPAAKLATADVFQEYFRGLYFKVEKSGSLPSNMALLNFAQGKITIKYKALTDITTDDPKLKDDRTLVINLTGSTASLLNDVKDPTYLSTIQNAKQTGDDRLYLKGGQGSLAVLELKDFAAKLETIRANKWMVNEANLVFHIDADQMAVKGADNLQAKEAKRVYLYDLDNNIPIVDYTADGTSSITSDPRMTKVIYGGIINVDATTKRGTTYKIRLTSHIRNLIKDATAKNVRLGLVVVDDINVVASNKLKLKNSVISEAPRATVLNPLGTVLFGGTSTVTDANRLKLEIYYTKPN
ncbi:DUF4270 domain-containing protein [Flavobacterium sp. ANB]|uniref:DUF4270 domain-containing protein n=1 Tax=unclassified Flavobacterium TaxID=196869 RepID=UPI0012B6BED3|nr:MULTISPECIES: DUF4270 domain-containing protein [unclassified Flavobacterium]MBF4517168.1 DUF4270 domain-containing protein [Flavobacterium sp. ANB]MTD71904.1 DUF4270 family protein [Flavobacterium sp. LC2016-13]